MDSDSSHQWPELHRRLWHFFVLRSVVPMSRDRFCSCVLSEFPFLLKAQPTLDALEPASVAASALVGSEIKLNGGLSNSAATVISFGDQVTQFLLLLCLCSICCCCFAELIFRYKLPARLWLGLSTKKQRLILSLCLKWMSKERGGQASMLTLH